MRTQFLQALRIFSYCNANSEIFAVRNIISSAQALAKEREDRGGSGSLEYDDIVKMYDLVMGFNEVLKRSVQSQRVKREPGYEP